MYCRHRFIIAIIVATTPGPAFAREGTIANIGSWTLSSTERQGQLVDCHVYSNFDGGTRLALALSRSGEWRIATAEYGNMPNLQAGSVRLYIDGAMAYSGTTEALNGGGIRIADLPGKAVAALGVARTLDIVTDGGRRGFNIGLMTPIVAAVKKCISLVHQAEQREELSPAPFRADPSISDGYVNLRSGPSKRSDVVAEVHVGDAPMRAVGMCLPSLDPDSGATWCRFQWEGRAGWASMRIVTVDQSAPRWPTYEAAAKPRDSAPEAPTRVAAAPPPVAPPTPKSEGSSSGTGFFVGKGGQLLTNAHVVDGCSTITVSQPGSIGAARATLLARDKTNDLALLHVSPGAFPSLAEGPSKGFAALRRQVRLGEEVSVFGYPLAGIVASTGNFTRGNVTALAGLGDDSSNLQIGAAVQPGNSGGPVVDESGNVVAVVVSKLNALAMVKATGSIPEQINFAIKASTAAAFLETNGVAFSEADKEAQKLSPADLADKARKFTVQVLCIK